MTGWLSQSDRERIEEFAQTPKYERSPEMLSPEANEDEEE